MVTPSWPRLSIPTWSGLPPEMIWPLMVCPLRSTVMPSAPMTSPFPGQSSRSPVSTGECGVLGHDRAAAQRLGRRRPGAERQQSEREDDNEDEVAGYVLSLVRHAVLPDAPDPCKPA
jgi:hypothetical protein